jgi:diaminopimelate epimerase
MTTIPFVKYHGTGNDFILIDQREVDYQLTSPQVAALCDRHRGIGADGLMLLERCPDFDFNMVYYNSDGQESSMCGNGGRCISAYAKQLGMVDKEAHFLAIDGPHVSRFLDNGWIELEMKNVTQIHEAETYAELDTGSPHYVHFTEDVRDWDMKKEGALIRYSPKYKEEGINVNFVEIIDPQTIFVRTYERGVEDETLSCGTGVTAAALVMMKRDKNLTEVAVRTLGGNLQVSAERTEYGFTMVRLIGPATYVFQGSIALESLTP